MDASKAAKLALFGGSVLAFLGVALGAFGAHALEARLLETGRLDVFETANRYHFYHAIALLVIGVFAQGDRQITSLKIIIGLMLVGVLVFSGSLYLLAITNLGWLGAITPVGGLLLLLAWLILAKDVLIAMD